MTAETRELVPRPVGRRRSAVLGALLALSAVYLAALLFRYVFGIGTIRRHHVESASYIFAAVSLITALTRSASVPSGRIGHGPSWKWTPLALVAMAVSLYASTLLLGLFSDDFVLVQQALDHDWTAHTAFVRPLPLAVWDALLTITGNAAVLHAFSIVLHGVNAALVYALALRIGLRNASAAAAGALFVVFPASVEAVVWPAAIHDLIVAASALGFVLLASRRRSRLGWAAATLILVAGLLSKESAVAIPLLAAVVWLQRGSAKASGALPCVLAGLAVCALYVAVRMAVVAVPESFAQAPTRYMLKELIARPIGTLTIPWNAHVVQSWPVVAFLWALGAIVAAAAYAWSRTNALPVNVVIRCVIAAFVAVGPVYSMLFITPDLENARYLYLSTGFWVIALVAMASPVTGLTPGRVLALGAAIVAGAVGVQLHLTPWREAARTREQVLAAAAATLRTAQCSPVSFLGAPDSVRGAYVFRNGLSEAIRFRTGATPAPASGLCTFEWNGAEFQRTFDDAGPVQASIAR